MRSLSLVIRSVLNGDLVIPELPGDKLLAFQECGTPIGSSADSAVLLKVARLQTLIVKEREKGEIPEMKTLKSLARIGGGLARIKNAAMAVRDDTASNIIMLERLIVEIVRDACPREGERFGVTYSLDSDMRICFSEVMEFD